VDNIKGTSTITIQTNKLKLYCPDATDSMSIATNIYLLPVGDFDVRIDLVSYDKTVQGGNVSFRVACASMDNEIRTTYRITGNVNFCETRWRINGGGVQTGNDNVVKPTKMRIVRDGDLLKTYEYSSGTWNLINSVDFGVFAAAVDRLKVYVFDNINQDGCTAYMDNLYYVDSCPSGATWSTTTSTTSSSSTTTTTAPP